MEPPTNRSRLAQLIAEGAQDEDGDELNYQPHEVSEMRDPDVQLAKKREAVGNRFQAAMSSIFDKYGRDFEDVGDEIDFETGEIVVDNGHLANMRYDGDIGSPGGLETAQSDGEEEEGILLEDWEGESHASDDDGSVGVDEGHALPPRSPPASKDAPSAPADLQELGATGGYPWNFGPPPSFWGPGPNSVPFWPFPYGQQPPYFTGQPGAAFPSLDQHPALLPFTNFYPPFMSGPFGSLPTSIPGPGAGASPLSQTQPKKRVPKSLFTSRFSSRGKKNDSTEEAKDETANSDSENVQPAQDSRYITDDEDELLSEQYTIAPQNKEDTDTTVVEEPPMASIISPSVGLNSIRDETAGTQDRVSVEIPEISKQRRKQYRHISMERIKYVLPTPPTSVVDTSDSDGDRNIYKLRVESPPRDPDSTMRPGVEAVVDDESQVLEDTENVVDHGMPVSAAVTNHDMPGPDLVCAKTEENDTPQGVDTINEPEKGNDIGTKHTRIKSEDNTADISLLPATTYVHTPSGPFSPPRSTGDRDSSTVNELLLSLGSESPAEQPMVSQGVRPPRNPELMYISPTKHIEPPGTKHSPVKLSSERGSATPHRISKMPLTPRHARTSVMRTPSTRRSILSLLSDEEEDEILLSEKHTVSIPNLFSSSRRKRGRSERHNRRSGIYDTPTKKRPRKDPPPKVTNSAQAVCGVDNYRCGGDFCFNCLAD
ncbi:unnamed protein product [Clonostachys rosea]|uniref:Myb-like DNA-binding domain protein n=1 Tax=Bionectria ochroleuca TaxID=29856 RepID=A0ABY6V1X8_BIOOC|nr:unnamed protein product [Clonostachys rosea]